MKKSLLICICVYYLVAMACNFPAGVAVTPVVEPKEPALATMTSEPLPAVVSPTEIAVTETIAPTWDNVLPTPTVEPTQFELQVPATILILSPGPGSVVAPPVKISGEADPAFEQNLVVQISGEDGNVIMTGPAQIMADVGRRGAFSLEAVFVVTNEQHGRISIYETSMKDGGLLRLASVEVILRPEGEAQILPNPVQSDFIRLDRPENGAEISGGMIHLEGFSQPVFESQLGVVICGEGGSGEADPFCGTADNVITRTMVFINSLDLGQPGPFAADIPYRVDRPTHARLLVYDASARDGGITQLSSHWVILNP